jgi:uncharacterized protein involved in response to NO
MPLLLLVATWLAGRMAVTFSASTGWMAAAAIDVAFLVLLAGAALREIVAGRNWRNLKIVAVVCVLAAANLAFHVEAHVHGVAEYSTRVGIAAVVLLITLVGGRIIPSFTHNWLVRARGGRLPAPFGRFDAAVIAATAARADKPSSGECPARALIEWPRWPLASLASAAARRSSMPRS